LVLFSGGASFSGAELVLIFCRDLKQSYSNRTKSRPIAIINRNHVLIRLPPPLRRMEFSEATGGGAYLKRHL
jgi:hypothetical protein